MTTPALGAVFLPHHPPERLRETALAADQAGVDELWLWEDCFRESGVAAASATLAWTGRLRVGVGLLPVPLRNVALTAMEIATLTRLFPGRLELAVGHGVQEWMAQVGAKAASPLTLLDEYTTALRALLSGETVSVEGRYVQLRDVALDWPPANAPRILAGAVGDKTLRLAGRVADGTVLVGGTPPDRVTAARGAVEAGRREAGRPGAPTVVVFLMTATGPDAEARMAAELRTWPGDLQLDHTVAGDAAAVAAAVQRWGEAGADTVVLQPTADADPAGFARFTGEQVRPLLAG